MTTIDSILAFLFSGPWITYTSEIFKSNYEVYLVFQFDIELKRTNNLNFNVKRADVRVSKASAEYSLEF